MLVGMLPFSHALADRQLSYLRRLALDSPYAPHADRLPSCPS